MVNLDHFGEGMRFENDSVLLAMMAGIIATRAESAAAASATGAVSQAYTVVFWWLFLRKTTLEPPHMIKTICAKFRKQNHRQIIHHIYTYAVFLSHFRPAILHDLYI